MEMMVATSKQEDENTAINISNINNNKSEKEQLSLVMDVTKQEHITTHVVVQREKTGKLRYLISKEFDNAIDGSVNASPTVCNQIRQDSIAKDYIPVFDKSMEASKMQNEKYNYKNSPTVVDLMKEKNQDLTNNNNNKSLRKKEKKRKYRDRQNKKRMEKIQERNLLQTFEVTFSSLFKIIIIIIINS